MCAQQVAEPQCPPVVIKLRRGGNHVQVMRARAARSIALDKPGVPRRYVVAKSRPPKVFVPFTFKDRRNARPRCIEIADLDQHIYDRLSRQSRYRRAAIMLDATEQVTWQNRPKMCLLFLKVSRPTRIVGHDRDF